MDENMTAPLEAPAPVETTLTHLQLVPRPEQYARLADLQIKHKRKLFPCHSSALAMHSNVLCTLFDDTDRQEWASGIAAVLAGHVLGDVEIYLTLVHSPELNIKKARKALGVTHDLLGVAKLAHQLDSSLVLSGIDSYLSASIDTYSVTDKADKTPLPLFWLPKVENIDMPKTKAACMARVIGILLNETHGTGDREQMELSDLSGCNKQCWEALSPETLLVLLRNMARARNPAEHIKVPLDSLTRLCQ